MSSALLKDKNPPMVLSSREVEYFKKNLPLHHAVLQGMIARKEAIVEG